MARRRTMAFEVEPHVFHDLAPDRLPIVLKHGADWIIAEVTRLLAEGERANSVRLTLDYEVES